MSLFVLVFIAVAFLIGSSAAMDNPGRVDSSRASIFRVDSQLLTSAAVLAGAQFVSLLVARYSKSALQQGLILCIPSAWVVGWHLREYCCTSSLHSLLLEKSPRLRVATLAQVFEYFAVVLPRSELMTAVLAVMHADVPERRALLSSLSAALSTESML